MNQVAGPQGNWMRLLLDLLLHEPQLQVTTSHQKSCSVTCLPFWIKSIPSTSRLKTSTILTHWFPRHFHKNPPSFKKKQPTIRSLCNKPFTNDPSLWTPRVSKFNESRLMCELEVKLNASKTLMSSTRKNGETGETCETKKKWTSWAVLSWATWISMCDQTEELASLRITRKTQSYRKMLEEMCYRVFGICSLESIPMPIMHQSPCIFDNYITTKKNWAQVPEK